MSGLFGDIGVKDIFGRAVKFIQSPYGAAAAAALARGEGLGQAAFEGSQYAQQQQQLEYLRKMQEDQLNRQMQNDDYSNALKAAQIRNYGMGPKRTPLPSSIREWNAYNALSPEDQQKYLLMKRAGFNKIDDIGGVPTYISKPPGAAEVTTKPLSTYEKEAAAQSGLKASEEVAKLKARETFEAQKDLPKMMADATESIRLIDEMVGSADGRVPEHPGFRAAVGPVGGRTPSFLGPTLDFESRFDQIKGKQFMEAYQGLKGGGQITEIEGTKAENAISRMRLATTEAAFINAAREFQQIIRQGLERAKNKAGGNPAPIPPPPPPQNDPLGLFE